MNSPFSLELNITKACNFRCTYCYENDTDRECFKNDKPEFELNELVNFIREFKDSEYIQKTHNGEIKLTFWGGEPLLEFELLYDLVLTFLDDDSVSFFLYTNGFFKQELFDLIDICEHKQNKFNFQISYDGHTIHQKNRKFHDGTDTVDIVYNTIIETAKKIKRAPNLKPTIPVGSDFKFLFDAYKDYLKLFYYFKDELQIDVTGFRFKPTPAIAHEPSSEDAHLDNPELYYETINKIGELDVLFYELEKYNFFDWFKDQGLSVCGAGRGLATVDRDYKVYSCHNFLYYDDAEIQGHILYDPERDKDMTVLFRNLSMFNNCSLCSQARPTEKCKKCDVKYCIRCNVAVFGSSNNPDFLKRWTDYGVQNNICELWKINYEVRKKYFK